MPYCSVGIIFSLKQICKFGDYWEYALTDPESKNEISVIDQKLKFFMFRSDATLALTYGILFP